MKQIFENAHNVLFIEIYSSHIVHGNYSKLEIRFTFEPKN